MQVVARMDALSETMRAVRVGGALFFSGEFSAPWRFITPRQEEVAAVASPGSERLVLFHLVTEGEASARIEGIDAVPLQAGDIVVFPHGDAHELWRGRGSRLFPGARLLPKLARGEFATESWGGGGPPTRIVCGYMACEHQAAGLFLAGLPPVLKVDLRGEPATAWVESMVQHCARGPEPQPPVPPAVLARLAEALFVATLCRYMDALPADGVGWLAGARDARVGRAIALMHREPARAWSLQELAAAAGTSRTVLAGRFMQLMGESPLAYLARWRLQLGARRLLATDWKVLRIAQEVGYASEAAFSRAFARAFGLPPGRYRRQANGEVP